MANTVAPIGLAASRLLSGADWNQQGNTYYIPSTDTNAYYVGDPVASIHAMDANGVPGVGIATAGSPIRGVIMAVVPQPAGANALQYNSVPASKGGNAYYVIVADDPNIIFTIQDDGLNTLTGTAINKNANFTLAAPSTQWQFSATVLNTGSVATTSTLNLRILGITQTPSNAPGAYATWDVLINNHELRGGTAGTP